MVESKSSCVKLKQKTKEKEKRLTLCLLKDNGWVGFVHFKFSKLHVAINDDSR